MPPIIVIQCEDGNEDIIMQEQSKPEEHERNQLELEETPKVIGIHIYDYMSSSLMHQAFSSISCSLIMYYTMCI